MTERGGRRPGAGAPQGNLNALRSGRRTRRLRLFRRHLRPVTRPLLEVAVAVAVAEAVAALGPDSRPHERARARVQAFEEVVEATAPVWNAAVTWYQAHSALLEALRPWLERADENGRPLIINSTG